MRIPRAADPRDANSELLRISASKLAHKSGVRDDVPFRKDRKGISIPSEESMYTSNWDFCVQLMAHWPGDGFFFSCSIDGTHRKRPLEQIHQARVTIDHHGLGYFNQIGKRMGK